MGTVAWVLYKLWGREAKEVVLGQGVQIIYTGLEQQVGCWSADIVVYLVSPKKLTSCTSSKADTPLSFSMDSAFLAIY